MNNLKDATKAIGSIIRAWLLTLLVLILCTCSGVKLTLGDQTLEKQIDYSLYSGKLAKQTADVTACHISKTDVLDFRSWHPERLSTWPPYQVMHGLGYCPNLAPMRRKCSRIKSYPYRLTTRSFSNQYKTEWIDRKRNWRIGYQHPD